MPIAPLCMHSLFHSARRRSKLYFALSICSVAGPSAAHAQLSHISLRFDEEDRRTIAVAETLATNDSILRMYSDNYDASHLPDGWATFVHDLVATDAEGRRFDLPRAGLNQWRVPAGTSRPIHLQYNVLIHHDQGHFPHWYEAAYAKRECDCTVFVGGALFIGATDLKSTEITFVRPVPATPAARSPRPWLIVTPWDTVAGHPDTYRAADFEELAQVAIAVGKMLTETVQIGATSVTIAMSRAIPDGIPLFRDATANYLNEITRLVGPAPRGHFVIIANLELFTGGGAFIRSASMVFDKPPGRSSLPFWGHIVSHELLHLWNGRGVLYADADEEWFKEGVNDYLSRMIQVHTGDMTPDAFMEVLSEQYRTYQADPHTVSLRTSGADKMNQEATVYDGGFLAGFVLDVQIREASRGRAGIADALSILYTKYGDGKHLATEMDIQDAIASVAGKRMDDFFRDYVAQRVPVPTGSAAMALGYAPETVKDSAGTHVEFRSVPRPSAAQNAFRASFFAGADKR
jgi:predicted metalloprotease with PDZ domain